MAKQKLRLVRDSFPGDPVLDTAVSRALLERVTAGELPDSIRLARPGPMVPFGKQDAVSAGYLAAAEAARQHRFAAVVRLAGGRAAVFHEDTVELAHAVREPEPRAGIQARFEDSAAIVAAALRRVGVDARVGEVPGEYCPGGYSVSARGRTKLAGIGQRVIRGGAHVGAVVVAAGEERIRDVLVPVYEALGLDWDPATAGSAAAEAAGLGFDEVVAALVAEYDARYELEEGAIDEETLARARRLAADHRSAGA